MSRLLLSVFLVVVCLVSNAQLSAVGYKSKEYDQLLTTKTHVVLTGDFKFDENIKQAMKEWTLTPYEFISGEEFNTKLPDKTASFILPVVIGTPSQAYHYIALINGGKKKIKYYDYNDMLAYAVINHYVNEVESIDCGYRVANMIASMVQTMDIIKKNDIRGNSKNMAEDLLKYYRTLSYKIPKRILLVNEDAIGKKMSEEEFGKIYPHKFEFCHTDKIERVIKSKDKNYYYYQPAITLNKCMFVFDPETGEVVYGDYQMMGLNINKKNIEMLVDAISGK